MWVLSTIQSFHPWGASRTGTHLLTSSILIYGDFNVAAAKHKPNTSLLGLLVGKCGEKLKTNQQRTPTFDNMGALFALSLLLGDRKSEEGSSTPAGSKVIKLYFGVHAEQMETVLELPRTSCVSPCSFRDLASLNIKGHLILNEGTIKDIHPNSTVTTNVILLC